MTHRPVYDTAPASAGFNINRLDLSTDRVAQLGAEGIADEIASATHELADAITGRVARAASELAASYADAFALAAATGGEAYSALAATLSPLVAAFGGAGLLRPRTPTITPEVAEMLAQHEAKFALAGRQAPTKVPLPE